MSWGCLLKLAFKLEFHLGDTVDWGKKWLVDFNAGKTQLIPFDWSINFAAIDMKLDVSILDEQSTFKILRTVFIF